MRICFFTNTFLPHVGGVARSVQTFLEDLRRLRQRVLVVAPTFAEGAAPQRIERSVERVPAIQNFNGSDFAVRLPLGAALSDRLARFRADVIHSHHPFLLGDTALRVAALKGVPVVFTHHTLYEQYTHYVPFDSARLKDFVVELCTRYANRCRAVVAPSESIAKLIRERGVFRPIRVIPTGIDTAAFASGDRARFRSRAQIPPDAVVIGHVGRLAPEKNLEFLAAAAAKTLREHPAARFVVVGDGPSAAAMRREFSNTGVEDRAHFAGKLTGRALLDAYAALDVFAFSSQSETQGMVLAEAMAGGNAVVALDASGVREVVRDGVNGRLLPADAPPAAMAQALGELVRDPARRAQWRAQARGTAADFDRARTAAQMLEFYREVVAEKLREAEEAEGETAWDLLLERIAVEGRLVADKFGAVVAALSTPAPEPAPPLAAG